MRRMSQVTKTESWGGDTVLCRDQQMPILGKRKEVVPLRN